MKTESVHDLYRLYLQQLKDWMTPKNDQLKVPSNRQRQLLRNHCATAHTVFTCILCVRLGGIRRRTEGSVLEI